jgi:hypothetical protein
MGIGVVHNRGHAVITLFAVQHIHRFIIPADPYELGGRIDMGHRHTELNDDRADLMSRREQDQKFVAAVTKAHPTLVDVGRVPVANTKPISARMTQAALVARPVGKWSGT